jgi:hypothetical protein
VMQCILADFNLVNPPANGCAIPLGAPSGIGINAGAPSKLSLGGSAPPIGDENLEQVVHQVFDEMKNRGLL